MLSLDFVLPVHQKGAMWGEIGISNPWIMMYVMSVCFCSKDFANYDQHSGLEAGKVSTGLGAVSF